MRGPSLLPATTLRQARYQLVENGALAAGAIDEGLMRSWQRSLSAGLAPRGASPCADNLSGLPFEHARAHSHALISHSEPIMEYLFEQVRHSHSMVVLADQHGVLMHTLGDLDFLGKAERVALKCGASWHESQRGTNAIGTALAEAGPLEIHGAEHFLDRNGFLTCAAAPIHSAQGELLGILDISGDHRSRHPHTLGLVTTAARMIENSLLLSSCQGPIVLQMHPRTEGIGSVAQGLLALSEDGWLMGANRTAMAWLGLRAADIGARALPQLLDLRLDSLLAHLRQSPDKPMALRDHSGQLFHALAKFRPSLTLRPAALPTTPPPNALDRLDTGDLRWRAAADKALKVVDKGIPVLLLGESGVGKELFAKALHASSQRSHHPFVAINCAAIPEALIESELFGYSPGAFTGGRKQGAPGRLREAQGGTLFLDEIGDMPLALQTRLLRVLQERQVTPLGGGEPVAVDFALICATHQSLRDGVAQGRFRSDLYYRINGLGLKLPALRERSDFAPLTQRLLRELGGNRPLQIAPALRHALEHHPWPGNLRQFSNVLRTAVALLEPEATCIDWQHLPEDFLEELQPAAAMPPTPPPASTPVQNLQALSEQAIAQALAQARGNMSAAARLLGISRQTLYRRLPSP
ncbi:MAG: sigma-54-dependent Fis family transcriptional regulator [Burkholderiaceae bacterium]|nr:sigma-54-dependent Fis family transcriptional regulator [Burkholderiaceae bacterium]